MGLPFKYTNWPQASPNLAVILRSLDPIYSMLLSWFMITRHELLHHLGIVHGDSFSWTFNQKWLPFALYPHFLFPLKLAFNLLSSFVWGLFSGIGCITKVGSFFFSQTLSVGIFAPGLVSLARHWHAMLGRSGNVVGPWLARCLEIMGTYSKSE